MASTRAGRDARGAMNDLPIPGQPDFNIDTMRPVASTPTPAAPANGLLGPLAGSPVQNAAPTPSPAVPPTPPPMGQDDINDLTNQRLLKILAPDPNDPTYQATPVPSAPSATTAGGGGGGGGGGGAPRQPQPQVPDAGVPNTGIPTLRPGSVAASGGSSIARMRQQNADVIRNQINSGHLNPSIGQRQLEIIKSLPGGENTDISVHPPADDGGFDLKKWAIRLGIPLGVAALLFRKKLGSGAAELGRMFDLGGGEIAPNVERTAGDFTHPAYTDDTIAPATDEARARVNEASGGQPVTQETQDNLTRQMDINSGKIPPQDYQAGEKPRPGSPGYQAWFKFRQDQSKATRGGVTGKTPGNMRNTQGAAVSSDKKGGP